MVKNLIIQNIVKEQYVETETNGTVTLTDKIENAMMFTIDGDESESDAECTLALLNDIHEDGYTLIEIQIECQVCGDHKNDNTRPDHDSPNSMRACDNCGSEWTLDGVLTFDARELFSDEENKQLGRNPK